MLGSGDRVLVTGASGQDGGYLLDELARRGVETHGVVRSSDAAARLAESAQTVTVHVADLRELNEIGVLIREVAPTHIVNLAGVTSVAQSWREPIETSLLLGMLPIALLEAALELQGDGIPVRVVQASSAEIFGDARESPQTEDTPRKPINPYGAAKNFADDMVRVFRNRGLASSSAILFNHESPNRPETFVSKKIVTAVARIAIGESVNLELGNLDAQRDWGYAPDYARALISIAEAPVASDYVVATGVAHSVRDFVEAAFRHVSIADWRSHVVINSELYRPADPVRLVGDASRLRALGWQPSLDFDGLVATMVDAEVERLRGLR